MAAVEIENKMEKEKTIIPRRESAKQRMKSHDDEEILEPE